MPAPQHSVHGCGALSSELRSTVPEAGKRVNHPLCLLCIKCFIADFRESSGAMLARRRSFCFIGQHAALQRALPAAALRLMSTKSEQKLGMNTRHSGGVPDFIHQWSPAAFYKGGYGLIGLTIGSCGLSYVHEVTHVLPALMAAVTAGYWSIGLNDMQQTHRTPEPCSTTARAAAHAFGPTAVADGRRRPPSLTAVRRRLPSLTAVRRPPPRAQRRCVATSRYSSTSATFWRASGRRSSST